MGFLSEIDNLKRVAGRNLRDLATNPRSALERIADTIAADRDYTQGVADSEGLRMRPMTRDERSQARLDSAMNAGGGGALGIIKGKGGNWLTGSVENALSGLLKKERYGSAPAYQFRTADTPLNSWIQGPLTKYVKRDMATEGDPVRKLAEQGILHFDPRGEITSGTESKAALLRSKTGNLAGGLSDRGLGRAWETISDASLEAAPASQWKANASPEVLAKMPWINKLPESEMVYERSNPNMSGSLGFNHLTDELSNALNPESGLPRHLQLTPEQMQQLGMEKAVRHVHDINEWRAAEMAKAKASNLKNASTLREYPEGHRWVTIPDTTTPEGMELSKMVGCEGGWCTQGEEAARRYGGGDNKLYVLIDKDGNAQVQIATTPGNSKTSDLNGIIGDEEQLMQHYYTELEKYLDRKGVTGAKDLVEDEAFGKPVPPHLREGFDDWYDKQFSKESTLPANILEIKGKQNRKPNDEYIPFVQDFVRNHPEGGQWGDVGDLQNTDLIRHSGKRAEALGPYSTDTELSAYLDQFPGYAEGGEVKAPEAPKYYLLD